MSFQPELAAIQGAPGIHACYQFLGAVLSPWVSGEQAGEIIQASSVDWEQVFGLAAGSLVSPLLWERINQKNLTHHVPEDFRMALQVIHSANCERNAHHKSLLIEATRELNKMGIEPILLKGAHSLAGIGPDEDCRIMSDVDLLIPDGRAEEAQAHLLGLGYWEQEFHSTEWYKPERNHQLLPLFHPTLPAYLELHNYPFGREHSEDLINFVLSDLQLLEVDGSRLQHMTLSDRLLYNQFHHYYSDMERNGEVDFRFMSEQAAFCADLSVEGVQRLLASIKAACPEFLDGARMQLDLMQALFGEQEGLGVPAHPETGIFLRYMLGNTEHEEYRRKMVVRSMLKHGLWLLWHPVSLFKRLKTLSWYQDLPSKLSFHYKRGRTWKPDYKE